MSLYKKKKTGIGLRRPARPDISDDATAKTSTGQTAAHIRILRDLADLDLPPNVSLSYADEKKKDPMNFSLIVKPTTGFWNGATYEFTFVIPPKYPFDPPNVTCIDKIYHPNIDLPGKVCVSVLRPWKPVHSIQMVLHGLLYLFFHPNPNDPLNNEASADMRQSKEAFARNVSRSLKGATIGNVSFPKNRGIR